MWILNEDYVLKKNIRSLTCEIIIADVDGLPEGSANLSCVLHSKEQFKRNQAEKNRLPMMQEM